MIRNLNSVMDQMEDVDLMIRIRENGIAGAVNIVRPLSTETVFRLTSMYWACDYNDLVNLKTKLERRFLELADISELANRLQTK